MEGQSKDAPLQEVDGPRVGSSALKEVDDPHQAGDIGKPAFKKLNDVREAGGIGSPRPESLLSNHRSPLDDRERALDQLEDFLEFFRRLIGNRSHLIVMQTRLRKIKTCGPCGCVLMLTLLLYCKTEIAGANH